MLPVKRVARIAIATTLSVALSATSLVTVEAGLASAFAPAAAVASSAKPTLGAAAATTYKVTFVARQCPTYPDIMANRARNNIMESLQDVGNDSNYSGSQSVNPSNETATSAGQSACTPLVNWDFKLGTGIGGADTASTYGKLSKVSNAYDTSVKTRTSVPLLNAQGVPTGDSIEGATTVTLNEAQISGSTRGRLWLQGGVPGEPLNGATDKSFGALRCAIDNYNGDNVESIAFPGGATHVFCYAYYVSDAPSSATIIIKKEAVGAVPDQQSFGFGGDISYNPGGAFSLQVGKQQSFIREAGIPWTVTEDNPGPDFLLQSLSCSAPEGVTNLGTRTAVITPVVGQTITCTFTNTAPPPTVSFELRKISLGSTGSFDFSINGTPGLNATTTAEGSAADTTGTDTSALPIGDYTFAETLPTTAAGRWSYVSTQCWNDSGNVVPTTRVGAGFSIDLAANTICYATNQFTPEGKITVRAKELAPGGFRKVSATSGYRITDTNGVARTQLATNTSYGSFAIAVPKAAGDATTKLAFHGYTIMGNPPQDTAQGKWRVKSVTCDGGSNVVVNAAKLYVTLTLAEDAPAVTCDFTYELKPNPGTLPQVPNSCAKFPTAPAADGLTKVVQCQARTNVGKVKWRTLCTAVGRTLATRGDLVYCRAFKFPNGQLYIKTFGQHVRIWLAGTVPGRGAFRPWVKVYRWVR